MFPGASPETAVPWSDFLTIGTYRPRTARDRELQTVGERAYNRWLAEFCSYAPGRSIGLAFLPYHDIEATLKEIDWAADSGLKGVLLPHFNYDLPEYCINSYWDPIWSALEDHEMSINCHGGYGLPDYGVHRSLVGLENVFWAGRPMAHMILAGVFDRHPNLGITVTESYALWVPEALATWDTVYERALDGLSAKGALFEDTHLPKRRPSEYWPTNCFVGVSLVSLPEMEQRESIGVGTMMFGIDYPHPEGVWGQSRTWLQASLGRAEVPERDARMILGENAVRLYHLDVDRLSPIAERVGPTVEEVLASADDATIDALMDEAENSGRAISTVSYGGQPRGA
jgi:predicted TIM-barrel fold metal-dependent hydrolase